MATGLYSYEAWAATRGQYSGKLRCYTTIYNIIYFILPYVTIEFTVERTVYKCRIQTCQLELRQVHTVIDLTATTHVWATPEGS